MGKDGGKIIISSLPISLRHSPLNINFAGASSASSFWRNFLFPLKLRFFEKGD